jgi:hypothetical protein
MGLTYTKLRRSKLFVAISTTIIVAPQERPVVNRRVVKNIRDYYKIWEYLFNLG